MAKIPGSEDKYGNYLDDLVFHVPKDVINHPAHYISPDGRLETIDVIESFTADLQGIDAVCTANAIKYICRWHHKNGIENLKKAQWYIQRLINHLEKENKNEL